MTLMEVQKNFDMTKKPKEGFSLAVANTIQEQDEDIKE
jgi:hypothetical protein